MNPVIYFAPPEIQGDPELNAMLQAFYSRSKKPIQQRLAELGFQPTEIERASSDIQGIRDKLRQFLINYGHDSIGQCGKFTVFIENVSLLAAKAIQNNDLYDGQESSTRYIEFSAGDTVAAISPECLIHPDIRVAQATLIDLYTSVLGATTLGLSKMEENLYLTDDPSDPQYIKACRLKAFDVARCLLPGGATTNLSWTTSLSNFNREVKRLARYPLYEVRTLAQMLWRQARESYPDGIDPIDPTESALISDSNLSEFADSTNYFLTEDRPYPWHFNHYLPFGGHIDSSYAVRQGREQLPWGLYNYMHATLQSWLDFGSYRDIQRHRTLHPSPVLLSVPYTDLLDHDDVQGEEANIAARTFHPWYVESLKTVNQWNEKAGPALYSLLYAGNIGREVDTEHMQYTMPLGLMVPMVNSGAVGAWLYCAELRTGSTVHPTARQWAARAWQLIDQALDNAPSGQLWKQAVQPRVKPLENSNDLRVSFRRASQDIIKREQS